MSADNRSVSTDALATLGTIIGNAEKRDAIHLAVENVAAGQRLVPGDHICLIEGKAYKSGGKMVGIVDPFLPTMVEEGKRFWLIVYPRQINSLRHVWEHPDFPPSGETDGIPNKAVESERWIRSYAESIDLTYRELMDGAGDWLDHNEYLVKGGTLEGVSTDPNFWAHYQVVTGRRVGPSEAESFFSCSC